MFLVAIVLCTLVSWVIALKFCNLLQFSHDVVCNQNHQWRKILPSLEDLQCEALIIQSRDCKKINLLPRRVLVLCMIEDVPAWLSLFKSLRSCKCLTGYSAMTQKSINHMLIMLSLTNLDKSTWWIAQQKSWNMNYVNVSICNICNCTSWLQSGLA